MFLIASLPYLGDDICGSFLCDVQEGETLHATLSRKLFFGRKDFCPLSDKTILEKELIDNDVKFLYSSYVSDVLVESSSLLRGVVIVNRSGRQAIRSKMIIDATQDSIVSLILDLPREQRVKDLLTIITPLSVIKSKKNLISSHLKLLKFPHYPKEKNIL